jgi:hypothetical protein
MVGGDQLARCPVWTRDLSTGQMVERLREIVGNMNGAASGGRSAACVAVVHCGDGGAVETTPDVLRTVIAPRDL